VQILWFGRPQGKQMPQSESCVPRQDPIRRHDRLTLPSARAAPYSSMLLSPRRDPIRRHDRLTLPSARAAHYSSMLLSTPLFTRQTRRTRRTRPIPTLTPIVLSHASFNAQQYTDLLIVDATASSYRFKALVDTGAAVNLISPTLVDFVEWRFVVWLGP
jgi:hypothetical protein